MFSTLNDEFIFFRFRIDVHQLKVFKSKADGNLFTLTNTVRL